MQPIASHRADRRLLIFAAVVILWGGAILLRLFSLQVIHHADYLRAARHQQEEELPIAAPRGSIFDRYGQLLAGSVKRDSVYMDPLQVRDLNVLAPIVASILHVDGKELLGRMQWYAESHKGFMWLAHGIEPEQGDELRNLHMDCIRFTKESWRDYPRNTVAAHIVGAVDKEEVGQWGLEKSLEKELEGAPGKVRVLADGKGRALDSQAESEPRPGTDVTLTIDERIQLPAQEAIARAVREAHAESGSVVVMDPKNGDILAMASYPSFDPNEPPARGKGSAEARFNHAVSVPFEPGSVFKVITLSAALETTNLRPDTPINCMNGTLSMAGRTVHEAHGGYGTIPMAMVLAKSSNIGAIQIGLKVGANNLYDYVRRFGLGSRTGVPLPAESPGMVRKLSKWRTTSLMSVSMGHEVGVTTIQLAQVCSAVANGGMLIHPRLVMKRGDQEMPAAEPHRILRPETAVTMRQMMEGVVLYGTGKRAKLSGYSTGGKTGSAQIFDYKTGHYTHNYNASFMGFAPVSNPAIVVVATLNGTHGTAGFGGAVAAPVFHEVATEALRVLDVPRDVPDDTPEDSKLAVAEMDSPPRVDGPVDPPVLEETAEAEPAQPVYGPQLPPAAAQPVPAGPKAPNFIGMPMRTVVAAAQAQGLEIILAGNGVVRTQTPPPGAVLRDGERIRVDLAR